MGVIYLLYNDEGYGYIGQTINLYNRLRKHKHSIKIKSKGCRSHLLGADFKCEILEEVPNDYLYDYEQYYYDMYYDMFKEMIVNKMRPLNTRKEYEEKNSNKAKIRKKIWREKNADYVKVKKKEYNIENADAVNEYHKKYRDENKEIIKKKCDCECGGKYTTSGKATHEKTHIHKIFMEQKI
jgi:hypothetical protein